MEAGTIPGGRPGENRVFPKDDAMNKTFSFLLGLVLLLAGCSKPAQIDKTKEGGVEVVLNHLEPYALKGARARLRLEPEVTIDLEKEEYAGLGLKMPEFADADSKGNIYLVEKFDGAEYFVNKFNSSGKLVGRFGKKGQGPGEIQSAQYFFIGPDDRIFIFDVNALKLLEFNIHGTPVKETKVRHDLWDVTPLLTGGYLARRGYLHESGRWGMTVSLYDSDFNEVKALDSYEMSDLGPGKRTPGIIIPFYWRVRGDRIYMGKGFKDYEIKVFDLQGNLLRKIRKEFRPEAYPDEFKKQTETMIKARATSDLYVLTDMPPFNSFFIDDDGRIFVMTYEPGEGKDEYIHDIFSADGVFIGRASLGKYGTIGRSLNHVQTTAANGRFFRLRFKENGYPEVIVYRMAWE
jgi:hypothetical protein